MSHHAPAKSHMSDLERVLADIQSEADRRTHIGQMPLARVLDALHAVQKDAREAVEVHGRNVVQLVEDFRGQIAAVTRDNVFPNHVHVNELRELGVQIELEDEQGFSDAPKSDRDRDDWDTAIKGPNDSELRTYAGLERALAQLGPICGGGVRLNIKRAVRILAVLNQYSDQKAKDMGHSLDAIEAAKKYARYIRLQSRAATVPHSVSTPPANPPALPQEIASPVPRNNALSVTLGDAVPAVPTVVISDPLIVDVDPDNLRKESVAEDTLPASPAFTIEEPKGNWKKWSDTMIQTFLLRVEEGLQATPKRSIAETCRKYLVLSAQYKAFKKTHGASVLVDAPTVPKLVSENPEPTTPQPVLFSDPARGTDGVASASSTNAGDSFTVLQPAPPLKEASPEISPAEQEEQFTAWLALATGTSIPNHKRAIELAELHFKKHVKQELNNFARDDHPQWQEAYNAGLAVLQETFTTYIASKHGHLIRNYAVPKIRDAIRNALGLPCKVHGKRDHSKSNTPQKSATEASRRSRCVEWAKEQGRHHIYNYRGFVDWVRRFQMIWVYKLAENLLRDDRGKSTATEKQLTTIGYTMLSSFIDTFHPDTMTIDQIKLSLEGEMEERMLECLQDPQKFAST